MDLIQAIFLGALQGLTEFLPVSSSGHLALFQKLFGMASAPIFFDTMLHGVTLLAVIFYLRKDILGILKNIKQNQKIIWLAAVATLPAVFVGLFLNNFIEKSFNSGFMIAIGFFITAVMLFATNFFKEGGKDFGKINFKDAGIIGIFQAISIFSSISRSGATISSAIFSGIDRKSALKFSFLLSIPAILGAMVLKVSDIGAVSSSEIFYSLVGVIPAALLGFWSLKFLDKYMANKKFAIFGYYCIFAAIISLLLIK